MPARKTGCAMARSMRETAKQHLHLYSHSDLAGHAELIDLHRLAHRNGDIWLVLVILLGCGVCQGDNDLIWQHIVNDQGWVEAHHILGESIQDVAILHAHLHHTTGDSVEPDCSLGQGKADGHAILMMSLVAEL